MIVSRSEVSWAEVEQRLLQWSNHLEKANCEAMQAFTQAQDDDLVKYADKLDLSKGDNNKVYQFRLQYSLSLLGQYFTCPFNCS